jgi:hypothetical protein
MMKLVWWQGHRAREQQQDVLVRLGLVLPDQQNTQGFIVQAIGTPALHCIAGKPADTFHELHNASHHPSS